MGGQVRVKRDAGHVVICGLKSPKIPPAGSYSVFSKYHPHNQQYVTFHISHQIVLDERD